MRTRVYFKDCLVSVFSMCSTSQGCLDVRNCDATPIQTTQLYERRYRLAAGGTIYRTKLFGRDGNASALGLVQGTVEI